MFVTLDEPESFFLWQDGVDMIWKARIQQNKTCFITSDILLLNFAITNQIAKLFGPKWLFYFIIIYSYNDVYKEQMLKVP